MGNFFILPERYRDGLIRQLKARARHLDELKEKSDAEWRAKGGIIAYRSPDWNPAAGYARDIESAASIRLPEMHRFRDSKSGTEVQVIGWSEADALRRLRKEWEHLRDADWHWTGGGIAWPGFWSMRLEPDLEYGEEDPGSRLREAAAALLDAYRNGYPEGNHAAEIANQLEQVLAEFENEERTTADDPF